MVKTYKKMYRSNQKARKWLIENRFCNIHFLQHSRFIKDYHIDGADFDGLASKGTNLVLFQVKSNCKIPKKTLKLYKKLSRKYGIICLWINSIDRKGVEVYPEELGKLEKENFDKSNSKTINKLAKIKIEDL